MVLRSDRMSVTAIEDEVTPTRLVVGGVYRRMDEGGMVEHATCPTTRTLPSGRVEGYFVRYPFNANTTMIEGSSELDKWTLRTDPIGTSNDVMVLVNSVYKEMKLLRERIEALEIAATAKPKRGRPRKSQ